MASGIQIAEYDRCMKVEVEDMFYVQYNPPHSNQSSFMEKLYEHPYQNDRNIRLVALDGDKVVGFLGFLYWPYLLDGMEMNTFQLANLLIDPDHRRMGIFIRLLKHGINICEEKRVGILVGFPIEKILNSYIRNGLSNTLDLNWHVKLLNPLSFLKKANLVKPIFAEFSTVTPILTKNTKKGFTLNNTMEFNKWRQSYSIHNEYLYYTYHDERGIAQFNMKVNVRRNVREIIIGRIDTDTDDAEFIKHALEKLIKILRHKKVFVFASCALNSNYYNKAVLAALEWNGFKKINKKIHFILKDLNIGKDIFRSDLWELFCSDIDTW